MNNEQRATEIWARRGPQNNVRNAMTQEELDAVAMMWSSMPGSSCWMDAFFKCFPSLTTPVVPETEEAK